MFLFFGADLGDHYFYPTETGENFLHIEANLAGHPRYSVWESLQHFKKYYCYSSSSYSEILTIPMKKGNPIPWNSYGW